MADEKKQTPIQDGAPKIAKLVYKWFYNGLWYITVVIGVIMVYKPTYNWGAHPITDGLKMRDFDELDQGDDLYQLRFKIGAPPCRVSLNPG